MADGFEAFVEKRVDNVWKAKLGLQPLHTSSLSVSSSDSPNNSNSNGGIGETEGKERVNKHNEIVSQVLDLLEETEADFTLFWRELSYLKQRLEGSENESVDVDVLAGKQVFYKKLSGSEKKQWNTWLLDKTLAQGYPKGLF